MATPLVSVIMPVYNMALYLPKCLDSVMNQTLKEIEVICIDDGSTDESVEIIQQYQKKDQRIYFLQQKNQGAGPARNLGIRQAKGQFICFMDSDDYYPEMDILEILYTKAIQYHVQICGGEFACFTNENPTLTQNFIGYAQKYLFPKDQLIFYKNYQFDYGYTRFIYNREMLLQNDIFFPPYRRYQDPPFLVEAMITAQKFYAVHKITYAYRQGHKKIDWTDERIDGLLNGLLDNMYLSYCHGLKKLNQATYQHLKEHLPMITDSLKANHIESLRKIRSYYKPPFDFKRIKCYVLSRFPFSPIREKYQKKYYTKYDPLKSIIAGVKDETKN